MAVMDKNTAVQQRQFADNLVILRSLPDKKKERVFKLFGLLEKATSPEEFDEIALAIGEIVAKGIGMAARGQVANLEDGISSQAKGTLRAYYINTGATIRKRREELGLTQEVLAQLCGLPQSHISRLEKGRHAPTRVTIERIAKALETEPSKLDLLYD